MNQETLNILFSKGYTPDTLQPLIDKGANLDLIAKFEQGYTPEDIQREQNRSQEGFLASLGRSIVTPVAKMVARPLQLGALVAGQTPEQIDVATQKIAPYFGKDLATPKTGADVLKDVGAGLETVSLGIGGGGTTSAVKTGLKGLVGQGIKEGAITGLKSGSLLGFAQGLETASQEPPEKAFNTIFSSTALGSATGLIGGSVLGGVTPLVTKGIQGVSKFTKLDEVQNKLAEGFKKILNPTARQTQIDTRFGGDSFNFLAKELPDMPIQVDANGRNVFDDAIEMAKAKYSAEATAFKPIIRNSGKEINIDDVINNIKKEARTQFDGTDLTKAENQIDNEINSYLQNQPQSVRVDSNGKRFVSIDRADDIKTYSWSRGKGWGTPEAEVWNDTNNLIGHAFKNAIEKELPNAPIKAMNRRLGQWRNAIDMLEKRNGQVSGSGGKLSKYIIRGLGTSVGAGLGNKGEDSTITGKLTGAGAGYLTANALATLFANPNVRLFALRQLVKQLDKAGKKDLILQAQRILQEEASKYLLPAAGQSSFVEKAINLPTSARETNLRLGNRVENLKMNP